MLLSCATLFSLSYLACFLPVVVFAQRHRGKAAALAQSFLLSLPLPFITSLLNSRAPRFALHHGVFCLSLASLTRRTREEERMGLPLRSGQTRALSRN
ncbi:hypothetical protein BJV74DRAFT_850344 [Russula compacta]|nr:hypothetical protein BJV74DRAFT_850344 [Russula compacta]